MREKLICPNCERNGRLEILGEIDNKGNLCARRHNKGETRIISPKFAVQCGVCGEVVFYRKVKHDTKPKN